jgi:hypothetical protein
MQLEDLKAQARREGRDDSSVTLPRQSFVVYRTSTPQELTADEKLKRSIARAERRALKTSSKGLTMMSMEDTERCSDGEDEVPGCEDITDEVACGAGMPAPSLASLVESCDEDKGGASPRVSAAVTSVDELD